MIKAQSGDAVAAHQFDPKSYFAAFPDPTGEYIATVDHQDHVRLWRSSPGSNRREAHLAKSEIANQKSEISPGVAKTGALDLAHDLGTVSGVRYRHYRQIRFSPDGQRLVTVGGEKVARIWDGSTGELRGTLPGHHGALRSVDWSPDGRWIATGDELGSAKLWDAGTGRLVHVWRIQGTAVDVLDFSPDGRRLAVPVSDNSIVGCEIGKFEIWDPDLRPGLLAGTMDSRSRAKRSTQDRPSGPRSVHVPGAGSAGGSESR